MLKKGMLVLALQILIGAAVYAQQAELETIGMMSGQNLYVSYTAAGMLFDNFNSGAYNGEYSTRLCKDLIGSLKKSKGTIQNLITDDELQDEDADLAKQISEAFDSIITECNALVSVIENNNSVTVQQFQSCRLKAWSRIEDILKLNEE